jgi:hypothetical protein
MQFMLQLQISYQNFHLEWNKILQNSENSNTRNNKQYFQTIRTSLFFLIHAL